MPEIPVDYGQAQAVIQLTGDLEEMTVGMGFQCTPGHVFTQGDADAFSNLFLPWLRGFSSGSYNYNRTDIVYGQFPADVAFSSSTGAGVGTGGSGATPQNVAWLVQKRSGLIGRKNRGRCYIPGIQDSSVDETGGITLAIRNARQIASQDFRLAVEALPTFVGLSILHSLGDATQPTLITALTVDQQVATQRRRLRR